MADLTIYEVPTCSTCRKLSALLAERGVEFERVAIHDVGISERRIRELLRKSGLRARDVLRRREPLAAELGLLDEGVDDSHLIALMARHPRLLQRPIAERGERAVLARPVERVLELLG